MVSDLLVVDVSKGWSPSALVVKCAKLIYILKELPDIV